MYIKRNVSKKTSFKLELAPLIDVIFILLIFFAVSSTLMLQNKGIKLELPTAETSVKQLKGINISLTSKDAIKLNKKSIPLNQLEAKIKHAIEKNKNTPILFFADKKCRYDKVIEVLDKIRLAGGSNIVLEAEKKRNVK